MWMKFLGAGISTTGVMCIHYDVAVGFGFAAFYIGLCLIAWKTN